jgi:predicted PurR-regulated permease PerM
MSTNIKRVSSILHVIFSVVGIFVIFLVFLFIILLTYVLFAIVEGFEKLYQWTKNRGSLNQQQRPITDLERSRLQGA